jgi:transposase-like protein
MTMLSDAPCRQIMPNLDAEIERALTASIKAFGVLTPIIVDQNRRIIDGHNRARIAAELLIPCPEHKIRIENEADALEYAATLNLDRRTFSPETRKQMVAQLAAQGFSQRAIAGVVGASQSQVQRDLEKDEDQVTHDGSPDLPAKVTGTDGKRYTVTRTPEENEAILAEYESGTSRKAIAERMGMTEGGVGHIFIKARATRDALAGIPAPAKGSPVTPNRYEATRKREATLVEMAARGYTNRQIAEAIGVTLAGTNAIAKRVGVTLTVDKSHHHDSTRIASETCFTLEGAAIAVGLVDFDDFDGAPIDDWVTSLADSLRVLKQFHKQLKEMTQ